MTISTVGRISTRLKIAQGAKFEVGRGRSLAQLRCVPHRPTTVLLNHRAGHAGMQRRDRKLLCFGIGPPYRKIGDQQGWSFGGDAKALTVVTTVAVAEAREKVDLADHRTLRLLEGNEDFSAGG